MERFRNERRDRFDQASEVRKIDVGQVDFLEYSAYLVPQRFDLDAFYNETLKVEGNGCVHYENYHAYLRKKTSDYSAKREDKGFSRAFAFAVASFKECFIRNGRDPEAGALWTDCGGFSATLVLKDGRSFSLFGCDTLSGRGYASLGRAIGELLPEDAPRPHSLKEEPEEAKPLTREIWRNLPKEDLLAVYINPDGYWEFLCEGHCLYQWSLSSEGEEEKMALLEEIRQSLFGELSHGFASHVSFEGRDYELVELGMGVELWLASPFYARYSRFFPLYDSEACLMGYHDLRASYLW